MRFRYALRLVLLGAVYFSVGKAGLALAIAHPNVSAIWPATGLSIAFFLLFGYSIWPAILIGAWFVNQTTGSSVATSMAIAIGNTLEGFLAAFWLNRFSHGTRFLDDSKDVLSFACFGAAFAPMVSATIGVTSLMVMHEAPLENFGSLWLTWWLGDMVGAILVTPALVVWKTVSPSHWILRQKAEAALLGLGLGAIAVVSFAPVQRHSLVVLCMPLIVAAAFRLGQTGTVFFNLCLALVSIVCTIHGWGPFIITASPNLSLLSLQAFMGTSALMTLMISAVIAERTRFERRLAELNKTLEEQVAARTDELMSTEAKLHQASKLEAVGRLAGGIAHDFNNLLTGILGISEDLLDTLDASDLRRADVKDIMRAAQRAFAVTRQLLAFGRRQVMQPRPLDMNATLIEVSKLLHRIIGEDIEVTLRLDGKNLVVADPSQIEQIVLNLAVNARDAMPQGGRLEIRTFEAELRETGKGLLRAQPGHYMVLEVSDTGSGMSAEVLSHIFEPFFTTKEPGKGTGLGLATVYGIVEQNQGDIIVTSTEHEGTHFQIYWPISSGSDADISTQVQHGSIAGSEIILVVEDEEIVRRVITRKLSHAGYRVLQAASGRQAIELSRREKEINLVITDVVMPGLNGHETVQTIRQLRPETKVIYVSGYPEDVIARHGILQPGVHFIEKPLLSDSLLQEVRKALDAA